MGCLHLQKSPGREASELADEALVFLELPEPHGVDGAAEVEEEVVVKGAPCPTLTPPPTGWNDPHRRPSNLFRPSKTRTRTRTRTRAQSHAQTHARHIHTKHTHQTTVGIPLRVLKYKDNFFSKIHDEDSLAEGF